MSVQRVLAGVPVTLRATFLDQNGEGRLPSGDVTVTVKTEAGTTLVADAATTAQSDGSLTYTLPAIKNVSPNRLRCSWQEADGIEVVTLVETVGNFMFSIAEARTFDSALRDVGKFPDEDLLRTRLEIEEAFEGWTGRSFTRRYKRLVTRSDPSEYVQIPDVDLVEVKAVSIGDVTYAPSSYELRANGRLIGIDTSLWSRGMDVVVEYEYGMWPTPADAKREAIKYLRYQLLDDKSGVSARATSHTNAQGGTTSYITPGVRGAWTSLPTVNECLRKYAREDAGASSGGFVGSVRIQ